MAKWIIDPDHSVAAFSIRHMMIANVRGQFNRITGTIHFDAVDIPATSVEVEIDVSSITTGIKKRDEHLLSPDFFDVERYPSMTFRSTGVEPTGGNRARVTGDLTIHGTTRPVTFDAEYFGPVESPEGGEISMGFTAEFRINREDFGITWNVPLPGDGVVAGHDVQITLDVEADLAERP